MSHRPSPLFDAFLVTLSAFLEAERGRKTALAEYLGVRPHVISEWLGGKQPTAEYILGIQQWLAVESKRRH